MLARVAASSAGAHRAMNTEKIAKTTNEENCILNFDPTNKNLRKKGSKIELLEDVQDAVKRALALRLRRSKRERKESAGCL